MCLSAEVDLIAGVAIGIVGIDAVRHVRHAREVPLAALPLLLAVHQLTEALVWAGLDEGGAHATGLAAVYVYLVIAFGIVPVLVPLAVTLLEPAADRRRRAGFTVLGSVVAAVLLHAVVRGPVEAWIEGRHVVYDVVLWHGGVVVALYVVATCGPMLLSRFQHVRWYGVANLGVAVLLAWLSQRAFISLWCVWAAFTSVAIAAHLRHRTEASHVALA